MLTASNFITVLRIILVLYFCILFYFNNTKLAILIFLFSVITDFIDGLLARILKQQTAIGSFLDPVADKILVITTLIILMTRKYIPLWLFFLIILRDILLVIGWLINYSRFKTIKTVPRISGKITVFLQMTMLILVVFNIELNSLFLTKLNSVIFLIVAISVFISLIDYITSYISKNF